MMKNLLKNQHGGIAVIFAIAIPAILGFAILGVDVTYFYLEKARYQTATDAGALAGMKILPDQDDSEDAAVLYTNNNLHDNITITANDVEFGNWNFDTRVFQTAEPYNAIRVSMEKPVNTFFAMVLGVETVNIGVESIASLYEDIDDCFRKGIKAGRDVHINHSTSILGDTCIYADRMMHLGINSFVSGNSALAAPDKDDIFIGQGTDINGSIISDKIDLAFDATGMIDDLENGLNLPSNISHVEVLDSEFDLPDNPASGTVYIINGDLHLDRDYTATDVIFAVRGNIHWNDGGSIINTVDVCEDDTADSIGLIAEDSIFINKDAVADGVSIIAGKDVHINHELTAFGGSINAARDVRINHHTELVGCSSPVIIQPEDEIQVVVTRLVK